MFGPSKETVLHRWAYRLGPQRTVLDMLSHLGDDAILKPFAPGDEPTWKEALVYLMAYNKQFTLDEVLAALRHVQPTISPLPKGRKQKDGHDS